MNTAITPEITHAVNNILASHKDIAAGWIHGSRVKGTHRPESDLDIAIMNDSAQTIPGEVLRRLIQELQSAVPVPLHLGCVSADSLVFAAEVIFGGKLIYSRDDDIREVAVSRLVSLYGSYLDDRRELVQAYTHG